MPLKDTIHIVNRLAKERERHWLACKEILGLAKEHDYKDRSLWVEGVQELADFMNYMSALGREDLRLRGLLLGAEVLDESRKGD